MKRALVPGLISLACAAAVGAYALALGGKTLPATEALVPLGLALFLAGLVLRRQGTIPFAVLALGAAYVLARTGHQVVDGWAAPVGVGLLLAAELATWSSEHDARIHEERAVLRRRIGALAALVAAAALLGMLVVAAAAVSARSGLLLVAVGVAAAVSAVGLVLRLVRA